MDESLVFTQSPKLALPCQNFEYITTLQIYHDVMHPNSQYLKIDTLIKFRDFISALKSVKMQKMLR